MEEHIRALPALFEKKRIADFAVIPGVPEADLARIYQLSQDRNVVRGYARSMPVRDEAFSLMRRAYCLDVLVRGRWYAWASYLQERDLLCHPVRAPLVQDLSNNRVIGMEYSNTAVGLSALILNAAMREKDF